jgi:hypothetical protein
MMDPLQAILSWLFGATPAAGTPGSITPSSTAQLGTLAAAGFPGAQSMTGVPGAAGTPAKPGALSGLNIQQILAIVSALGAGNYGSMQLNDAQSAYQQQQQAIARAMNAAGISGRAAKATLPLNKELAYTVNNAADAGTANQGMGQSPGAVAAARAGALAPYAQQNLAMGNANANVGLDMPFQLQPPDYTSILSELNSLGKSTGPYSLPVSI